MILGLDTSNYTTSSAIVGKNGCLKDVRQPLGVPEGALGLRQSDALFQHVKNLPLILEKLFSDLGSYSPFSYRYRCTRAIKVSRNS